MIKSHFNFILFCFFPDIKAEAEHNKFKEGIEGFAKENLKTAETIEKNTLPTKEIIEQV